MGEGPIKRFARRRLERMLPRAEARLADDRSELHRLERFQRSFGGRRLLILNQKKRIAKAEARVEKISAALLDGSKPEQSDKEKP